MGDLPAGSVALAQNHPNPFNPRTEIRFALPRAQASACASTTSAASWCAPSCRAMQPAGVSTVVWSGEDDRGDQVASGLYFYRLVTDDGEQTRKMLLLK